MSTGKCPRCGEPLEGQVKLCALCGTTYHASCLRDTRDCVLCATQTGAGTTYLVADGKGKTGWARPAAALLVLALVPAILFLAYRASGRHARSSADAGLRQLAAEAGADLDLLRQAVFRIESAQGKRLQGCDPSVLSVEIPVLPRDPWGRPYLFDGDVGLLATFGSDGLPGGDGAAADLLRYFRRPLHIVSAKYYEGTGGMPDGGILQILFNKGFELIHEEALLSCIELVEPPPSSDDFSADLDPDDGAAGGSVTLPASYKGRSAILGPLPAHWRVARGHELHDPSSGALALRSTAAPGTARFTASIVPGRVNVDLHPSAAHPSCGLSCRIARRKAGFASPCDTEVFGPAAAGFVRPPISSSRSTSEQGVPIVAGRPSRG